MHTHNGIQGTKLREKQLDEILINLFCRVIQYCPPLLDKLGVEDTSD